MDCEAHLPRHACRKGIARLGRAGDDPHLFNGSRRSDAAQLPLRLPSGAEERQHATLLTCEETRRDARGGASAHGGQHFPVEQGARLAGLRVEPQDQRMDRRQASCGVVGDDGHDLHRCARSSIAHPRHEQQVTARRQRDARADRRAVAAVRDIAIGSFDRIEQIGDCDRPAERGGVEEWELRHRAKS